MTNAVAVASTGASSAGGEIRQHVRVERHTRADLARNVVAVTISAGFFLFPRKVDGFGFPCLRRTAALSNSRQLGAIQSGAIMR
jgi:hypothetical protein